MEGLVELVRRRKSQAPPPWAMWEALADPWSMKGREWFDFQPGELAPAVIDAERPRRVVWSSIWTDHPELRVRFDIEPAGLYGSIVMWTLLGREKDLDDEGVRRRGYRLDQLINGRLRDAFDQ